MIRDTPEIIRGPPPMSLPSLGPTVRRMTEPTPQQIEATADGLFVEIERYLAAVEGFRREGCEPRWRACEEVSARGGLYQQPHKRIITAESGGR
jgi:hypothetical protein